MVKISYHIFNMNQGKQKRQVIVPQMRACIRGHRKGWVFTPRHFAHLGDPRSVGMSLTRLKRQGFIRQIARGLYDCPRRDAQIGLLSPSADAIADALRVRHSVRLQPAGGHAAHLLGLSDQVPLKNVYLTDGLSRRIRMGNMEIVLKHASARTMTTAGRISGLVIQALRHLGKDHVGDSVIKTLRQRLSIDDKRQLLADLCHAPAWVAAVMRQVATTGSPQ